MIQVHITSAFSKNKGGGNKAGVVIKDYKLNKKDKIKISKKLGFSETAFIEKSNKADFKLEYYTPTEEVPLCGHATIASFITLNHLKKLNKQNYKIETNSGILDINIKDNNIIYMEQNTPKFYDILDKEIFKNCLDTRYIDNTLPIQIVSTGLKDIILPIKDTKSLSEIKLNLKELSRLSDKLGVVGLHAFSLVDTDIDSICRNFAPLYGINEESATGTSNCALACYLNKYNIKKNKYTFEQGYTMNEPSRILVTLNTDSGLTKEVFVGGEGYLIKKEEYDI